MPPRREIDALLPILEDPKNEHRDSEELARLLIEALDAVRRKVRRDAWNVVYPTEAERLIAMAIARGREGDDGWNPWAPHGPVCRCGVRQIDPRDSGLCPAHPAKPGQKDTENMEKP